MVTVVIAGMKGMISFGGTSQQTKQNTEDINDIQDKLDELVDKKDVDDRLDDLKGRVGDIEAQIHSIKEDIAYLKGKKED